MKYQSFITKLLAVVLIGVILFHYQNIAAARAAIVAENEAAIAEVEAYNRGIQAENQKREAAASGESGTAEDAGSTAMLYQNGTYEGTGNGYGGPLTVSVTIEGDTITAFEVLSHDGEDPAYYALAESLTETVLQEQSADVDTVSGATFSSKGILEALNDALDKAVNG